MQKNKKVIYNDNTNDESKEQLLKVTKVIFSILILCFIICGLTFIFEGNYIFGKEEVEFSYDEIIAGETFNRKEEEYYVVFYNGNDDNNIISTISSLTTDKKIYKVDLDNGFNKQIIGKSNVKANTAKDLSVENPTIIKVVNNENAEYVTGASKVLKYLQEIE